MTGSLVVHGAELVDGVLVRPGEPRRADLAIPQRVWRYLGPNQCSLGVGERFVLATRLHWLVPLKEMAQMGAMWPVMFLAEWLLGMLSGGVFWLQVALWLGLAAHQVMMCHKVLGWRATLVVVTSKRLVYVRGVFGNRTQDWTLSEITNFCIEQTPIQRLLGYGSVRIECAGTHDDGASREYIHLVPDPDAINQARLHQWAPNVDDYYDGRRPQWD